MSVGSTWQVAGASPPTRAVWSDRIDPLGLLLPSEAQVGAIAQARRCLYLHSASLVTSIDSTGNCNGLKCYLYLHSTNNSLPMEDVRPSRVPTCLETACAYLEHMRTDQASMRTIQWPLGLHAYKLGVDIHVRVSTYQCIRIDFSSLFLILVPMSSKSGYV